RNVVYRNLCMRDVPVPISISPFYNGQTTDGIDDSGLKGDRTPDYKGITLENVLDLTPGIVQVAGLNGEHVTEITLNGVEIRGIKSDQVRARHAKVTMGPKGANFNFNGDGVTSSPGEHSLKTSFDCEGKFVPYQD